MLIALDRVRLDPGTDVGEGLLGPAPVRGSECARLALGVVAGFGEGDALHATGFLVGREEVPDLLLERHRERILLDRGLE